MSSGSPVGGSGRPSGSGPAAGGGPAAVRHFLDVDEALVEVASPEVAVLHCPPTHRGEEITAGVVDGPHSVVWVQAAHWLTAMRGLFAWLVGVGAPGGEATPAGVGQGSHAAEATQ